MLPSTCRRCKAQQLSGTCSWCVPHRRLQGLPGPPAAMPARQDPVAAATAAPTARVDGGGARNRRWAADRCIRHNGGGGCSAVGRRVPRRHPRRRYRRRHRCHRRRRCRRCRRRRRRHSCHGHEQKMTRLPPIRGQQTTVIHWSDAVAVREQPVRHATAYATRSHGTDGRGREAAAGDAVGKGLTATATTAAEATRYVCQPHPPHAAAAAGRARGAVAATAAAQAMSCRGRRCRQRRL